MTYEQPDGSATIIDVPAGTTVMRAAVLDGVHGGALVVEVPARQV